MNFYLGFIPILTNMEDIKLIPFFKWIFNEFKLNNYLDKKEITNHENFPPNLKTNAISKKLVEVMLIHALAISI